MRKIRKFFTDLPRTGTRRRSMRSRSRHEGVVRGRIALLWFLVGLAMGILFPSISRIYAVAGTATFSGTEQTLTGDVTAGRLVDQANSSYYIDPAASGNSLITAGAASVSGNLVLNAAATIQTTNMQPLTIGSSTTGGTTVTSGGKLQLQAGGTGTGSTGTGSIYFLDSGGSSAGRFDTTSCCLGATGGTITYSGGYTIHTFTSSGTFTPASAGNVEYLVVGGGGGGGSAYGGGGGAGGFRTATGFAVTAQGYTVTVGGGGAAASNANGSNGSDSVFSSITAIGGGGGGKYAGQNGATGGSGGGGGPRSGGIAGTGGSGTAGQGYAGGDSTIWENMSPQQYRGGGGGGASAVGATGLSSGNGGAGTASSISGSSVTYAGGGGGGNDLSAPGSGGSGGGGAGGPGAGSPTAGTANTGGGGGGAGAGGDPQQAGAAGGSGIVIIRYPTYGILYLGSTNTSSQDLAEYYISGDDSITAGDVVAISNEKVVIPDPDRESIQMDPRVREDDKEVTTKGVLRKAEKPYDRNLIGVISTSPGVLMGSVDGENKEDKRMLALAGRVPVKIDPDSEPIEVGDFLTSSDKPGLATKATRPGYVVGRALESWQPGGPDRIEAFIQLTYYMGDIDPWGNFKTLEVDTLKAKTVETEALDVGGVDVLDKLNTQQTEIDDIKRRLERMEKR